MSRSRRQSRAANAATILLLAASGCAQSSPLLSQRTTVGTLKASVSQLEYENQRIKGELKGALAENRVLEDRLVREESLNGELSARLDDARAVLSRRGELGPDDSEFDRASIEPPARTLPAGRSERSPRRAPFARIPARVETDPQSDPQGGTLRPSPAAPRQPESDLGGWRGEPQSSTTDTRLWLPIAVGASDPSAAIR